MTAYQYDNLQRLSSQINYGPDGQALATVTYTYNLFDQVLTKDTVGTGVDMEETEEMVETPKMEEVMGMVVEVGEDMEEELMVEIVYKEIMVVGVVDIMLQEEMDMDEVLVEVVDMDEVGKSVKMLDMVEVVPGRYPIITVVAASVLYSIISNGVYNYDSSS